MIRTTRIAFAVALLTAIAASAQTPDPRQAFGIDRARALEAVVTHLYPGGRVEWSPELTLIHGDGRQEPLRVAAMALRSDAAGFTVLIPLEFPDTEAALEKEMEEFSIPAGRTKNELVAAKLSAAFAVTDIRRAPLPDSGVTVRVTAVDFPPETDEAAWPDAEIEYAATYVTADWLGEVMWMARIKTNPIALVSRLPVGLGRADKDGTVRSDFAELDVVDEQTISIASATSNQRVTTCSAACSIDGKVLLGLWWTTPTTAVAP